MAKIIGGTTATPMRVPDWNQTNPLKADYIKNKPEVCNVLKGSASGNPIALHDVSPLPHEIKVGLRTKNILPYPFYSKTVTSNGVTFTDNGDGTITANGTATAATYFFIRALAYPMKLKKGQTYTVSGIPKSVNEGGNKCYFCVRDTTYTQIGMDYGNSATFTAEYTDYYSYIYVYANATLDNVVIKPQLEIGTTATAYAPCVDMYKEFQSNSVYEFDSTITQSGVYTVESVAYNFDSDTTVIGFSDGNSVNTNWIEGEPFAVGDVVHIEVNGENQIFRIYQTVKKYGKNLFNIAELTILNGKRTKQIIPNVTLESGKTYTFSADVETTSSVEEGEQCLVFDNVNAEVLGYLKKGKGSSITFTIGKKNCANVLLYASKGYGTSDDDEATFKNIQIECGSSFTGYEPYVEPKTYTADENGNLSIIVNGENMTLFADEGVTMAAEYNRDINKAFAELQNAIISLGGNV
jgi:hypothetical protein